MDTDPSALIESDRAQFFREIFSPDIGLEQLLRFYIGYAGPLFPDQWAHLKRKLQSLLDRAGIDADPGALFDRDYRITPDFLQSHFPQLADMYLQPVGVESLDMVEILPRSVNEIRSTDLPRPLNHRSSNPERAAFSAYISRGGDLFVGPHQYQYFDETHGTYIPAASLRAFSRDILAYERRRISGPVVLIQDQGNGSNFAHFGFDWLTRVMYALETKLVDSRCCTFVMGGTVGPFQRYMISAICDMYGLGWDNFFFPNKRVLIGLDGPLIFFSDQRLKPLHPAQMAHPRSMELLCALRQRLPYRQGEHARRLFISRADAKLRKIANEQELISVAERHGFEAICLSSLSMVEQFAIMRGARQIVGAHGMGFTHIFLNEGPLSVLELFNPTQGTDAYAIISRALKFGYHYAIGEDLSDNRASYRVDLRAFARELDKLCQ